MGLAFQLRTSMILVYPQKTTSRQAIRVRGVYNESPGSTVTTGDFGQFTVAGQLSATHGNRTCKLRGFAESYSDGKEKGFSPRKRRTLGTRSS